MAVHEVAEEGFGREAETYERVRPSYPADAVAWLVDGLGLEPGRVVLDLAAGTGKFTRLLVPSGATVLAAEPVDGMRRRFLAAVPGVPVIGAVAEALPVARGALDAITVAQAFHWFDADRAFDEFARVLQLGGRVGLIWNARDRSSDWVNEVWSIMDRVEKRAPWRDHEHWRDSALGARSAFGPLHAETFRHEQSISPEGVVDRIASVSHVAVLPPAERERVLDEVRGVLTHHPDTRSRSDLRIPYRVDAYWCERA
ncbi:MAG TPA: methyltransferase domain-containing protein [Acidimicrobiia bacterium]|nr:methyltransferase domain-containing protein [Acidimicrobiia bacterium]